MTYEADKAVSAAGSSAQRLPRTVAPLTSETVSSYVDRLARAHHLDRTNLVDKIWPGGAAPWHETLAAMSGIPATTLAHALPEWDLDVTANSGDRLPRAEAPVLSCWHPRRCCPRCLAHRGITTAQAWLPDWMAVCRRHQLWIHVYDSDEPAGIDVSGDPRIRQAQQRLCTLARTHGASAVATAVTIAVPIAANLRYSRSNPRHGENAYRETMGWDTSKPGTRVLFDASLDIAAFPTLAKVTMMVMSPWWRLQAVRHGDSRNPLSPFYYAARQLLDMPDLHPNDEHDRLRVWLHDLDLAYDLYRRRRDWLAAEHPDALADHDTFDNPLRERWWKPSRHITDHLGDTVCSPAVFPPRTATPTPTGRDQERSSSSALLRAALANPRTEALADDIVTVTLGFYPGFLTDERLRVRLGELTRAWLAPKAAFSRAAYLLALGEWLAWCAVNSVDPLTANVGSITVWSQQLTVQSKGKNPAAVPAKAPTIRVRLAALTSWYTELRDDALCEINQAQRVERPRSPAPPRTRLLTRHEVGTFLDFVTGRADDIGTELALRDAALFCLMFGLGFTARGITVVTFADLTRDRRELFLAHPSRYDPLSLHEIPPEASEPCLRYWHAGATRCGVDLAELSGPLFATVPQRDPTSLARPPLITGRIVSALRTLAEQAGIVSPQSISADSATELRNQNLSHRRASPYATWQTYSAV